MNEQAQQMQTVMLHTLGEASRTPILRRPSDYGMRYEDVFFPALDGTVIEGCVIPGTSDKIIIVNHFRGANRSGVRGGFQPAQ